MFTISEIYTTDWPMSNLIASDHVIPTTDIWDNRTIRQQINTWSFGFHNLDNSWTS